MIQVSNDFITAVNKPSRQWRARLLHNGTDTGATTKSLTVKGGSMTESTFNICGCYSMSMEAIIDTANFAYENEEIEAQLGLVLANNSVEWITLGHFTITEVKRAKYTTTLIGAGNLSTKGGLEFAAPSLQTVANIISAVQTITGKTISIDSGFSTSIVIEKPMENLTCLEALSIVASVLGGFVTDKADGTIYIGKYPSASTYAVSADRMKVEPTFSDYNMAITGVKVVVSEASVDEEGTPIPAVEYQTSEYNLVLLNPYMTESAFSGFASALAGLSWRIGTVPIALGDPRIEATDLATVTVGEDSFSVPCHNFVHAFDGGLSTTITSLGDSESLSESQQTGGVTRQLKEIQADIIKAKKIEAELIEIGDHFFVGQDGHVHVTEIANDYTTGNNVYIDGDSVDVRQGTTNVATFGADTVIGEVGADKRNVLIRNSGIFLRNNTTSKLQISSDATSEYIQVGTVADGQNIFMRPSYTLFRHGATERIRIDNTGDTPFVRIGAPSNSGEKNLYLASNTIRLREGSTTLINIGTDTASTYVQVGDAGTSSAPNRNILIRPTKIAMRSYTTEDASFAYDSTNSTPVITLGREGTDQHNVKISNTSVALRRGTTDRILLSTASGAPWIRLGTQGTDEKNISITDGFVRLRNGTDSHLILGTDTTSTFVQIGQAGTDQNNVLIRPNGFYQRTAGTNNASFTYDSTNSTPVITLGRTGSSQKNVYITNTALQMRTATTVDASFGATTTVGRTSGTNSNVYITSTALQLRKGTTPYINLTTDGVVEVGGTANKKVVITESTLTLQGGTRGSELFAPIKMEGWVTGSGTTSAPYKCLSEVVNGAWTMRSSYDYITSQSSRGPQNTTCTETISGWGTVYKTTTLQSLSSSSMTERVFNLNSTKGVEILPSAVGNGLVIGWDGRLTYGGNSSPIGTVTGAAIDNVTLTSSNSWGNISSFSLPKGTWLVQVSIDFQTNATGSRQMCLSATSSGGEIAWIWRDLRAPVNSSYTSTRIFGLLTPTATTTYYVNGIQNSGASLTAGGRWQAVRIL